MYIMSELQPKTNQQDSASGRTLTGYRTDKQKKTRGFILGLVITLIIALAAKAFSLIPYLDIMGQLVIAILIGIVWRASAGVPAIAEEGIHFASKKLLRLGIILLGMRLNLMDIIHAGPKVFAIAVINITFTMIVVYALCRVFKVDKNLSVLTASGTAICGAAAVVAIASQIKSDEKETAVGAATVAILGTIFTLLFTLLYPVLGLTPSGYGIFSGATLHEIAHVIAAADPGGSGAVDIAVIVKLTRVALLVPVAILIGVFMSKGSPRQDSGSSRSSVQIPWFILGFLLVSGINSLGIIPAQAASYIVLLAYMFIAMAMAGLGLNVDIAAFRKLGIRSFSAGLIGSVMLSVLGYVLVIIFQLNT